MKKILFATTLLLLQAGTLSAKVELPSFIGDNMVLQRNSEVTLWGWTSKPETKVTVSASWTKHSVSCTADRNGKWTAVISTPDAGGPYELVFNDGEKLTVGNVLTGEVWLCSGQSNMEIAMCGYDNQPIEGAGRAIACARPSRPIRMCTVKKATGATPMEKVASTGWQTNCPEVVSNTSAVAYFFADMLQEALDVPVGLLISDWGGTPIETWMSRPTIEKDFSTEFDLSFLSAEKLPDKPQHRPCVLYNAMLHPLIPYAFKGIIWYQGCNNKDRPEQYSRLQPAFARMLREDFHNPDAPFLFVQLAPHRYSNPDSYALGYMCEAQERTLAAIPNSGMACTADVGAYEIIHPAKKKPVGERLAMLALEKTYGLKGFSSYIPKYESIEIKGDKLIVKFRKANFQLAPRGIELTGFELAGEDRVFHPAKGSIRGSQISVSSDEVKNPVAVRYCFRNWSVGTVFNNFGVPLGPFRSDNWDDIK